MSNVEQLPTAARQLTEFEALVAASPTVLDAIPGAVYVCDADGWLIRCNSKAIDLWGRTPEMEGTKERFCGSHRLFLPDGTPLPPEDCPMADAVRLGTTTRNAEVVIERPDGSQFTALVNIRALKDHNGNIQGAINCFQDISAQKAMEDEIRRKNRDLEDFFENSAVGLHIVSGEGIIVRANRAELALLGYAAEEYIGRHIAEFHVDAPVIGEILQKLTCGDKLDRYPARLRAKDGSIKHVLITSNGRFDDGKFVNTRCFTMDVTHLHDAERALRDSEQHMRDVLEALPAAVYTTDANGRITFFNKACIDMTGRTPQIGDEWCVTWRLHTAEGKPLPHDQCPMAVALKEDRPVRGVEAMAERPDGTFVPFTPYPTPLHDGNGKLIGAINMLVDITERKQAENRQKTLIDELNHRVKNTLATVQSLAMQTARHSESLPDFFRRYESRLLGLARAHDLLTTRHWEDAPLGFLAREVLGPMSEASGSIHIEGPPVTLSPQAALSLTMALNEFATNAAKYGALSSGGGQLSLTWTISEDKDQTRVDLLWQERGGPPVEAPTRRGFGTRLIERCIERDLGGELDLVFDPAGLYSRMSIPLADTAVNG